GRYVCGRCHTDAENTCCSAECAAWRAQMQVVNARLVRVKRIARIVRRVTFAGVLLLILMSVGIVRPVGRAHDLLAVVSFCVLCVGALSWWMIGARTKRIEREQARLMLQQKSGP